MRSNVSLIFDCLAGAAAEEEVQKPVRQRKGTPAAAGATKQESRKGKGSKRKGKAKGGREEQLSRAKADG